MNRDHVLFLLIGLLLGFVSSYLLFESMVERQPTRLVHGADSGDVTGPGALQAPAQGAPPQGQISSSTQAPAASGGPPVEAVRRLREYVAANPTDADAVLQLANLNFNISNWLRARDLYQKFLELRPDDPDALSDLGICLRELQSYDEALGAFDRALAAQADHWVAHYNKVIVLAVDLKEYPRAEGVLNEMAALRPDDPDLARLRAEVQRLQQAAG